MPQFNIFLLHATKENNKSKYLACCWQFTLTHTHTHSIYELQYESLPYQPTVQGLSSQTPLSRRSLNLGPIRKFCRILVEGRDPYWSLWQTVSLDEKEGRWKGLCQGQKVTTSSMTGGPSLSKSSRHKVRKFGVKPAKHLRKQIY